MEEFKYRNYINFVKSDGYPRETTRNCRKYIKILNSEYTNTLYIKPCLKESKYEVHTLNVLNSLRISDKNIIDIEREKTFKDGKYQNSNSNFRFDFYLKVKNNKDFLIEVDGQQHFNFTKNWQKTEEKFLNHKQNDIIKDRYIKEKGLKLLRIHYKDIKECQDLINEMLSEYDNINSVLFSKSYDEIRNNINIIF